MDGPLVVTELEFWWRVARNSRKRKLGTWKLWKFWIQHKTIKVTEERLLRWLRHLKRMRSYTILKMLLEGNAHSRRRQCKRMGKWIDRIRRRMIGGYLAEDAENISLWDEGYLLYCIKLLNKKYYYNNNFKLDKITHTS